MSSTRKFVRGDKKNYSNEEKLALGELVEKYKKGYDEEVKLNEGKTRQAKKKRAFLLFVYWVHFLVCQFIIRCLPRIYSLRLFVSRFSYDAKRKRRFLITFSLKFANMKV